MQAGPPQVRGGTNISDEEMKRVKIVKDKFHGEWNYTSFPSHSSSEAFILCQLLTKARKAAERDNFTSKLKDELGQMLALLMPGISRTFGVSEKVIERRVEDEELWP